MRKRKSLGKTLRFKIFKRDKFTCQYCGENPPKCILEIDHIQPVSKGGDNDIDNLVTACFDCNRGKRDSLLSEVPASIEEKRELLFEKESQLKAYKNLKSSIKRRQTKQINLIDAVFQESFPDRQISESSRRSIRTQFIDILDPDDIEYSMQLACSKCGDNPTSAIKYFFGICWNKVRENN